MKRVEIVANAFIVAFFLAMMLNSLKLHEIRRFGEIGSGFWPILILSIATVLSGLLFVSSVMKHKREKGKRAEEPSLSPEEMTNRKNRRRKVALSAVLLIIYVIVMPWIGFVLSTFLYVLAFILVLGERRKWVVISSPILVTGLVILIFSKFIAIPFPRGMGLFAAFSRFFD